MVIILMGVTGSGKTTVGQRLASEVGWQFLDADDFHPPANKAKMHAGMPLTDEDRWPWLDALHDTITKALADGRGTVLACSALKASYRDRLSDDLAGVHYVLLDGDYAVLQSRLAHRPGHFMNPALLDSQIATLERPTNALVVDVADPIEAQVNSIRAAFAI